MWNNIKDISTQSLMKIIQMPNPREFIAALVFSLLFLGAVILAIKCIALIVNGFAVWRLKRKAEKWWCERDQSGDSSTHYIAFTSHLLGQSESNDLTLDEAKTVRKPTWWAIWSGRMLLRYIYGLYNIRHCGGSGDAESLRETIQERLDRWLELPRYLAVSFILLGLFGTVIGLSRSMHEMLPLIRTKQISDLSALRDIPSILLGTIQSMEIALDTTISGLIGTLLLSLVIVLYRQMRNSYVYRMDDFIQTLVIPGMFPAGWKEQKQIQSGLKVIQEQLQPGLQTIQNQLTEDAKKRDTIIRGLAQLDGRIGKIEGTIEKRLVAMQDLVKALDDSSKQLDVGGNRIMAFITLFEQSVGKQIAATDKIQEAQKEFNRIIESFREVLGEVRKDSKAVLDRLIEQQQQLDRLLSSNKETADIHKEKMTELITSQTNVVTTLQQENAKMCEILVKEHQQIEVGLEKMHIVLSDKLNTLQSNIAERLEAIQPILKQGISDAATSITNEIKNTYELGRLSFKELNLRHKDLLNQIQQQNEQLQQIHNLWESDRDKYTKQLDEISDHLQTIVNEIPEILDLHDANMKKLIESEEHLRQELKLASNRFAETHSTIVAQHNKWQETQTDWIASQEQERNKRELWTQTTTKWVHQQIDEWKTISHDNNQRLTETLDQKMLDLNEIIVSHFTKIHCEVTQSIPHGFTSIVTKIDLLSLDARVVWDNLARQYTDLSKFITQLLQELETRLKFQEENSVDWKDLLQTHNQGIAEQNAISSQNAQATGVVLDNVSKQLEKLQGVVVHIDGIYTNIQTTSTTWTTNFPQIMTIQTNVMARVQQLVKDASDQLAAFEQWKSVPAILNKNEQNLQQIVQHIGILSQRIAVFEQLQSVPAILNKNEQYLQQLIQNISKLSQHTAAFEQLQSVPVILNKNEQNLQQIVQHIGILSQRIAVFEQLQSVPAILNKNEQYLQQIVQHIKILPGGIDNLLQQLDKLQQITKYKKRWWHFLCRKKS
jgi:hypothetical protein